MLRVFELPMLFKKSAQLPNDARLVYTEKSSARTEDVASIIYYNII